MRSAPRTRVWPAKETRVSLARSGASREGREGDGCAYLDVAATLQEEVDELLKTRAL